MSKNKSSFIIGLLSFKHWLLHHHFGFMENNSHISGTNRNYSHQIVHYHPYHRTNALPKYHFNYQIHQKINLKTNIMETTKILIGYAIYLPIAIGLTYYVSKTLFKNSKIFMLDIFNGREEIALATNKLFETGFYLLNLGFALMILELYLYDNTYQELIEKLSYKIGGFSIYLGLMLFFNLYFFFRGKRKAKEVQNQERIVFKA
jgi:hypothetical protein